MEDEIQLIVEDAYPIDVGRGIIRLHLLSRIDLNLSLGDVVEIRGKKKTTAIVGSAYNQDCQQGTVRIDNFIRQNAGVSINEKVTIKKVEVPEAKKIVMGFLEDTLEKDDLIKSLLKQDNEILKREILNKPISMGDIVPIIISLYEFFNTLITQANLFSSFKSKTESLATSQVIPLVAVYTEPFNTIVKVSRETKIDILDEIIQDPEKKKELEFMDAINSLNQMLKPYGLTTTKNEITQEITLCETKDTFISVPENTQKKIVFTPSIFEIPKKSNVSNCVSVMIPFSSEFDSVYGCINDACYEIGMACHKADELWHHSTIIQDIFELIFRASIVIVDFTNKNPNVFYEAGIAHALGKTVIPITQNSEDIPFDLRHHRYLLYQNDREGLKRLKRELVSKLNFERNRE